MLNSWLNSLYSSGSHFHQYFFISLYLNVDVIHLNSGILLSNFCSVAEIQHRPRSKKTVLFLRSLLTSSSVGCILVGLINLF